MSQTQDARIQAEVFPQAVVVALLDSRITDVDTIETIGQQLNDLIDRDGQVRVVLSFDRVNFMGSYFLAKLLNFQTRLEKHGGRLALCRVSPALVEIFQACGVKKKFRFFKSEPEAFKAF